MRIACVGGGPAGLFFIILARQLEGDQLTAEAVSAQAFRWEDQRARAAPRSESPTGGMVVGAPRSFAWRQRARSWHALASCRPGCVCFSAVP